MTQAVRLAGVAKTYGSVRAVDGTDLTIGRGETVALLGPNGLASPPRSTCCWAHSAAIGKTATRNRMEAVQAARAQGWL